MQASNRTVHGLWIGSDLSKLELLTICSFVDHGHDFNLWTYSDIHANLPRGVSLRDAAEILPADCVFKRSTIDNECGVGSGSCAGFSDLFRYKLLYEYGGYWTDMDVTCLKPFDFQEPYLFRSHRLGAVGNVMKCPPHSKLMEMTYNRAVRAVSEDGDWHFGNRALSKTVDELGLTRFIRNDISNEDKWSGHISQFIDHDAPIPESFYLIHWLNECWRTLGASDGYYKGKKMVSDVPDKNHPKPFTTLANLYKKYCL
jgi:hypothetical protein